MQKPVYTADGLSFLPPFLSEEFTIRRSSARESLTELMITELGDSTHKSPYLIVGFTFHYCILNIDLGSSVPLVMISLYISHTSRQSKEVKTLLFDFSRYQIHICQERRMKALLKTSSKSVASLCDHYTISEVTARCSSQDPRPAFS